MLQDHEQNDVSLQIAYVIPVTYSLWSPERIEPQHEIIPGKLQVDEWKCIHLESFGMMLPDKHKDKVRPFWHAVVLLNDGVRSPFVHVHDS